MHSTLQNEVESFPHGNLCAALCTSTKTTTKIRRRLMMIDVVKKTCYVSCSAGACVDHSHEAMSDQIKKIAPFTKLTYSPESELPLFNIQGFGGREGGGMHIFSGLLLRKYCDRVVIFSSDQFKTGVDISNFCRFGAIHK